MAALNAHRLPGSLTGFSSRTTSRVQPGRRSGSVGRFRDEQQRLEDG